MVHHTGDVLAVVHDVDPHRDLPIRARGRNPGQPHPASRLRHRASPGCHDAA